MWKDRLDLAHVAWAKVPEAAGCAGVGALREAHWPRLLLLSFLLPGCAAPCLHHAAITRGRHIRRPDSSCRAAITIQARSRKPEQDPKATREKPGCSEEVPAGPGSPVDVGGAAVAAAVRTVRRAGAGPQSSARTPWRNTLSAKKEMSAMVPGSALGPGQSASGSSARPDRPPALRRVSQVLRATLCRASCLWQALTGVDGPLDVVGQHASARQGAQHQPKAGERLDARVEDAHGRQGGAGARAHHLRTDERTPPPCTLALRTSPPARVSPPAAPAC